MGDYYSNLQRQGQRGLAPKTEGGTPIPKLSANQAALLKRILRFAGCWVLPEAHERRSAEALLRRGLLERTQQCWGKNLTTGEENLVWVYRATTKGATAA